MGARSRLAGPSLACLLLLIQLWLPRYPALAAPVLLEDLHYRMEVLSWQDAARVKFTLLAWGRTALWRKSSVNPKAS